MITRRSLLKTPVLAFAAKLPTQTSAAPLRWYKPTLGWRVKETLPGVPMANLISMFGIALSHWHFATGLRFEYGGDDFLVYTSSTLGEYVAGRAEMPASYGESRTCNVWLNSMLHHTISDADRRGGVECDLLFTIMHEIGHVLGFSHTGRTGSIMRPSFDYPAVNALDEGDFELARERYSPAVAGNYKQYLVGVWR